MKGAYYNEIDLYAAQWIRNLIDAGLLPAGEVDERSIEDVRPDDLRGFAQCHFFAGIGVWPYALRCVGWPDDKPVWSGSCPCQPFSAAAMQAARRVIPIYLDCVDCSGITQSHAKAHCGDYAACLADWEKTQKLQRIAGNDLV